MRATITEFNDGAPMEFTLWWIVTVEYQEPTDEGTKLLIHSNWTHDNGDFQIGDEIEFDFARPGTYSNVEYPFVKGLRRVSKKAMAE